MLSRVAPGSPRGHLVKSIVHWALAPLRFVLVTFASEGAGEWITLGLFPVPFWPVCGFLCVCVVVDVMAGGVVGDSQGILPAAFTTVTLAAVVARRTRMAGWCR